MSKTITSLEDYRSHMSEQATAFQNASTEALKIYDRLRQDYPSWIEPGDIRLAYFARVVNYCNTMTVTTLALCDCLADADWHRKRINRGTVADLNILLEESDKSLRQEAFLGIWAQTENAIRRIRSTMMNVLPSGPIINHCRALYKTDLRHVRADEFQELVLLVTRTRNTSHNDFVYYPDRGGSSVLKYKGTPYAFDVGAMITFFTWKVIHERTLDQMEMMDSTVRHGRVASIAVLPSR